VGVELLERVEEQLVLAFRDRAVAVPEVPLAPRRDVGEPVVGPEVPATLLDGHDQEVLEVDDQRLVTGPDQLSRELGDAEVQAREGLYESDARHDAVSPTTARHYSGCSRGVNGKSRPWSGKSAIC